MSTHFKLIAKHNQLFCSRTDPKLQSDILEKTMKHANRSGCPINQTLEVLGDRWSLIILRDMMFGNRRHFRELLNHSLEGIKSNILSDRLKTLESAGVLSRADDPSHKQKVIYSLTEQGIELFPLLVQASNWGLKYRPTSKELSARAKVLADGGPKLWNAFMDELRDEHLAAPRGGRKRKVSVRDRLQAAYEEAVQEKSTQ